MTRDTVIFIGIGVTAAATMIGLEQYNTSKERALREKKLDNERSYFDKLSPEQVENIEKEKLELKKVETELEIKKAEARTAEAELKKTIDKFKADIQSEIQRTTNSNIERDMRRTFDDWAGKYEDRLDKKVDRVVSRIDDLSDKYGGVKQGSSSAPTISVVNAPNN